MHLQKHDLVIATFTPVVTTDIRPDARVAIGERGEFQALWIIEDGPYAGDWAMMPLDSKRFRCTWVPLCDLSDIELLESYRTSSL